DRVRILDGDSRAFDSVLADSIAAPVSTRAGAAIVARRAVGQDRVRRTDRGPAVAHLRQVTRVGRFPTRSPRGQERAARAAAGARLAVGTAGVALLARI